MSSLKQYFRWANDERFALVQGMTTGRSFNLREHAYGVLVPDSRHPLSAVSISNSAISIDYWTGCSWQCRYCHVQGTCVDLIDNGKMSCEPVKRTGFALDEIIDELVLHPYFVPDETVISIGTSSTEPFAPGKVLESTFDIMRSFIRRGLKNPYWIITKAGVPSGKKQEMTEIVCNSRGLMIGLCWADNPVTIEPISNNRFRNCEQAKEAGAKVVWYMRPLVREWGISEHKLEMMMQWVSAKYGQCIDMVVPGGLRWTEGIENGLVEIHRLPMLTIRKKDNEKELDDEIWTKIFDLGLSFFPGVPIYRRSVCAISALLTRPCIASIQFLESSACENSLCSSSQRAVCSAGAVHSHTVGSIQLIADEMEIPIKVVGFDKDRGVVCDPSLNSFTYAVRKAFMKRIAGEKKNE